MLLPRVSEDLSDRVLEARASGPFTGFGDLAERARLSAAELARIKISCTIRAPSVSRRLNVNRASQPDLENAGIARDITVRIVRARDHAPFKDFADVAARTGLRPHELAQIHRTCEVGVPKETARRSAPPRLIDF